MNVSVFVLSLVICSSFWSVQTFANVQPDPKLTPGVLCTSSDPDYRGPDYPEGIARCNRNISDQEKIEVAAKYGDLPRSEWHNYEFDHLIPLCAGGSNSNENLWPQPIDEAKQKDILEVDICTKMRAGTLKQADALKQVRDWFLARGQNAGSGKETLPPKPQLADKTHCIEKQKTKATSLLKLEFTDNRQDAISDPRLEIEEAGIGAEVTSANGEIVGRMSRANGPPLAGHYYFTVRENQDRFDLYLPAKRRQKFAAFVKISLEDSFPKLVSLECVAN